MEDFFKKHPLGIALGVAGFLLFSWFFDSALLWLVGAAVGAFLGSRLER